jgi:hypothetical protein
MQSLALPEKHLVILAQSLDLCFQLGFILL